MTKWADRYSVYFDQRYGKDTENVASFHNNDNDGGSGRVKKFNLFPCKLLPVINIINCHFFFLTLPTPAPALPAINS